MSAPPYYSVTYPNEFQFNQTVSGGHVSKEEKFRTIVHKHEISLDFSQRLQQLQGFKIVFIFDDSGSMNTPLMDSPLNTANNLLKATRWDEAQYFAKISIEIASLFDTEGLNNKNGCLFYFFCVTIFVLR